MSKILYVLRWDVRPEKSEEYESWVPGALQKSLDRPGPLEVRAYRPVAGEAQVALIYEFASFDEWTEWFNHEDIQVVFHQLYRYADNVTREIWEPSPLVPDPILPGEKTLPFMVIEQPDQDDDVSTP